MLKKEFLKKLGRAINTLPADEKKRTLDYYSELIDDSVEAGSTEEEAVAGMGDVSDISKNILADAGERGVKQRKKMSKPAKIVLAVCLSLLGVIILFTGTVAMLVNVFGVEFTGIVGEWREVKKEFTVADAASIDLDLESYNVSVGISPDDKVHITYYENKVITFRINSSEERLSVKQKTEWWSHIFIKRSKTNAELLVPESYIGSFSADVTSGNLVMTGFSGLENLYLHATSGNITVENVSAKEATLKGSSGKINLSRIDVDGWLSVKTTSGDITVSSAKCGWIYVGASSGDIKLDTVAAQEFETNLTSGATTVRSVTVRKAKMKGTSGNVRFDGLDATDISVSVTSGSISGTLAGSINDYRISTSVTSGKSNLPNGFGNGERSLWAEVTSGNINIDFLQD